MDTKNDQLEWEDERTDESEFEPEVESEEEEEAEEKPFNPELIRVESTPITIDHMQRLIDTEKLKLNPDFQRRKVWTELKRKSLLIESLMLRIPLPVFYVYEDDEGIWHVVDGLQRLSTIYEFTKDKFALRGLQYLKNLDGRKFSDLEKNHPKYYNRIMNNVKLTINVIDATTPPQVKYDIFRRINTGGVPLNAQEIRNATAKDHVRGFLAKLAANNVFEQVMNKKEEKDVRLQAQELVLRFVAFYQAYDFAQKRLTRYTGNMDALLDDTLNALNRMKPQQLDIYEEAFLNGLQISYHLFNQWTFRRISQQDHRKKPINKALLTCLLVVLSHYDLGSVESTFTGQGLPVRDKLAERFDAEREFNEAFGKSTTGVRQFRFQFEQIHQFIEEVLGPC